MVRPLQDVADPVLTPASSLRKGQRGVYHALARVRIRALGQLPFYEPQGA